ncbi:hypothetical protein BDZ97DRAFT_1042904 [Flammula alnicola]|nr:hypothetical protein BDZ97DRAFT_1042904 [Flammula alnicola]
MRNVEGAPLLEYLRLSPMDLNVEFFSFYFGKTPCLKSLDISHVYLSSIRIEWENLTLIQIKHLGVDEILEVLSRGTRLVDCKVSEILGDLSVFALPTPFLVHNSLRIYTLIHIEQPMQTCASFTIDLYFHRCNISLTIRRM